MKLKVNKFKIFFTHFVLILMLAMIVSVAVTLFIEQKMVNMKSQEIKREEKLFIAIEKEIFTEAFEIVISDLMHLQSIFDIENKYLEEYCKMYTDRSKVYNQISFIGKDGYEQSKIDYKNNKPTIASNDSLYNVKDQKYFEQTSRLHEGQIFITQENVDIEYDKSYAAKKPEIIFSAPVYKDGMLQGVIAINYNAKYLINKISCISINSNGYVYILDDNGSLLYSNNLIDRWGYLKIDKSDTTFKGRFPAEWADMDIDGSLVTDNGLFTYTDITIRDRFGLRGGMSSENIFYSEEKWKIVSYIEADSEKGYYISSDMFLVAGKLIKEKFYTLIYLAMLSLLIAYLTMKNKISRMKIKYIYEFDPMTNVYNRRAGFMRIGKCITNIAINKNVVLFFLDVNGLKDVNDEFGHNLGDELLITVVNTIKQNIRENDFLIRLGGDEFLIVLPKIKINDAEKLWDRITQSYDKINATENRPYRISVSHGIAVVDSIIDKDTLEHLITKADDEMYAEKRLIKQKVKIIK